MIPRPASDQGCLRAIGTRVLGCFVLLIALGVLVLAFGGITRGLDALAAPWAYPLLGRPTLTGHWAGTFTTPSGIHFALYIELERATDPGGGPMSDEVLGEPISGRADWCDDRGRHLENSPVSGSVPPFTGYTGSAEQVSIQIEAGHPPPVGLLPTSLKGHLTKFSKIEQQFGFFS
jgi:hypothetical protein